MSVSLALLCCWPGRPHRADSCAFLSAYLHPEGEKINRQIKKHKFILQHPLRAAQPSVLFPSTSSLSTNHYPLEISPANKDLYAFTPALRSKHRSHLTSSHGQLLSPGIFPNRSHAPTEKLSMSNTTCRPLQPEPERQGQDPSEPCCAGCGPPGVKSGLTVQVFLRVDLMSHRVKQLWLEGTSGGHNTIFCSEQG